MVICLNPVSLRPQTRQRCISLWTPLPHILQSTHIMQTRCMLSFDPICWKPARNVQAKTFPKSDIFDPKICHTWPIMFSIIWCLDIDTSNVYRSMKFDPKPLKTWPECADKLKVYRQTNRQTWWRQYTSTSVLQSQC